MDSANTSLETKVDQLTDQIQQVTLCLAQQGELLSSVTNTTPPRKKSRASTGTPKSRKKKEPHPLELVETDEIDYLKLAGHTHLRVVMGRQNACAPLPAPPTIDEKRRISASVPSLSAYPNDTAPLTTPITTHLADQGVISQGFAEYLQSCLSRVGLTRFTYDWDGKFDDQFNQFALQFFLRSFKQGIAGVEYGVALCQPVDDFDLKLTAFFYIHIQTLKTQYRAQLKNPNILEIRKDAGRIRKSKLDRCTEYQRYLSDMGVDARLVKIFDDIHVMGEEISETEGSVTHRQILIPSWWSDKFLEFVIELERRVQISILAKKSKGPTRTLRQFIIPKSSTIETCNVPKSLPQDCYSQSRFLSCLLPVQLKSWSLQPAILLGDVKDLFSPPGFQKAAVDPSTSNANSQDAIPKASSSKLNNINKDQSEFPEGFFEGDEIMSDGPAGGVRNQ